ncbi:hypothetical protein ACIRBX_36455 [Kitasatospora sp. NPDC096147]|uniref:hypothetical protein n=1 Tax=Kitasatospora sp. NPDC096147 TaxID=3364093 RepID=UPI00381B1D5B
MRGTLNRTALALTGLALLALSASVLLAGAGLLPGGRGPAWLPRTPDSPALPGQLVRGLSQDRDWNQPLALAVAAAGLLCLILLLAQLASRSPSKLRLHSPDPQHPSDPRPLGLRTAALAEAVRARALLVPGVADATARVGRGRRPRLDLTARLTGRTAPVSTVDPLIAVLTEARRSSGVPLRLRLRLAPAARDRRHLR